ncbi:hypothetical protein, partial [Dyadobacter sp.]|uniref:hypothetical protein n=1 Tax=Dyadobacter sp. TaxID=1914288 RepID=UPI003F6EC7DB
DPIKDGSKIFKKIHEKIGKDIITDLEEFEEFLKILLYETKGLMIVDFLDAGNWDRVDSYEIDKNSGIVKINWHDYRDIEESEARKIMRSTVFPHDVYGLVFQFQELRLLKVSDTSLFLLRGYSHNSKDVKRMMSNGSSQFHIVDNRDNFSVTFIRELDRQVQHYDFLNTPIISTVILPKNIGSSATISKQLLFEYNLGLCADRIDKAMLSVTNGSNDLDFLCEKSNTFRRVAETIMKIECCYRYRQITIKKSYSELLLGDLINLVKEFRSEEEKQKLNKIVRLANELSHDSGKPVTKEKTLKLGAYVKEYCKILYQEILSNPFPGLD